MTASIPKARWLLFLAFALLIVTSNILVYRTDSLGPVPRSVALGSLLDLVIVLPVLTYVLLLRKRYPLKHVIPVVIAGIVAAQFIIPTQYLAPYAFLKYAVIAFEGAFVLFELYLVWLLIRKVPAIVKQMRASQGTQAFPDRLEQTISQHTKPSRIRDIYCTEASIFYYGLFSWRKRPSLSGFTYHKKTGAIAFYVMLIHALAIESVGFHFLLHDWNAIVAIVLLILNIYTVLLFLAEIQAIRHTPFRVTDTHLYLQVGVMKRLKVALTDIQSVHAYDGPEKLSREEELKVFDAVLADFVKEKPALEITFTTPQTAKLLYGFTRQVEKAHLRPDDVQAFSLALREKLEQL